MTTERQLTPRDLEHLAERGISPEEAGRQLELLRSRPETPPIVRPCTLGDGIARIAPEEHDELLALWRRAAEAGWVSKFVPASGAATRMFANLQTESASPTSAAREVYERRADFAFASELAAIGDDSVQGARMQGDDSAVLATVSALVASDGLGLGNLPKALVPFHRYPDGSRTALIEQLVEGAGYVGSSDAVRVHFTVTAAHVEPIRRHVEAALANLEQRFGTGLEVSYSIQDPASDTLSIDDSGNPIRDERGDLVLRPSGHGALLDNLQQQAGSGGSDTNDPAIVVVKNIDNIQPEHRQAEVILWKRLLIGRLIQLEKRLAALADRVELGRSEAETAGRELAQLLGIEAATDDWVGWARRRLGRPTRVCGMVRNTGEPGGGPFWVRGDGANEPTPQIVEAAQVDLDDADQAAAWSGATHFNPVDLICSLRDRQGKPYDLTAFVDPNTAFVSRKESAGRPLWALERPGLWNGAMAGWNTFFVETPAATFAPVKTVLDLLRPEHQPPSPGDG